MTTDIRVPTRAFSLQASDSFDPDDGPWTVSGVAVGPGDILHMDDGTPVLMTEDELRKAAQTQAGQPLSVDHPTDESGKPLYPPPTDETAGKVPKAGYVDGRGLAYEANVHDPEVARGLHAENLEVSVHPQFKNGGNDPDTGAIIAKDIQFKDLSVVSKGDSPSNQARWGASHELAAWVHSGALDNELADASDGVDPVDPEGFAQRFFGELRSLFANENGGEQSDESAEAESDTGTDPDPTDDSGNMTNRKQFIETLVESHGFGEDFFEDMDDDRIGQMHSNLVDSDDPSDGDGGKNKEQKTENNVVELDIGDHDSVDDYIGTKVEDAVEATASRNQRTAMIDEIVAAKDDVDADDLKDTPESVLEEMHASIAMSPELPGATGRHTAMAGASDDDDDLDAYGTGVY
ncbi:hypothetical protein [Halocatena marina]|uniref:hypothetical protein n=1 Tax=Halocatena marina TaxID=2934937 RepID=UPI00200F23E5|nr:hypothetical protein [Halocatena marina]